MKSPPCFKCGKATESLFEDTNQPSCALSFVSYGHYGTTAFDPMDGSFLEINICDDCVRAARPAGHILHGRRVFPLAEQRTEYEIWSGAEG